jgi:hypothetical protein
MIRRVLIILLSLLLGGIAFAQERDVTDRDMSGIRRSHKYAWAIVGGTVLGTGIGVLAPGGSKSAVKGALIGGSLTSAFYLAKNPRAARGKRDFAHVVTNTVLGTGVLWTICDCKTGAWSGALIGGGGTAIIQSFKSGRSKIASLPNPPDQPTGGTLATTRTGSASQAEQKNSTPDNNSVARKEQPRPNEKKTEHKPQER